MSYMNDNEQSGWKVFREHSADVDTEMKANKQGAMITAQSDITGEYTIVLPGDEAGWLHCAENTRALGAWGQAVPCMLTEENGIIPILDKALTLDTSFAYKTEASSGNDSTKFRTAEEGENGTPGILVQCLNQDSHEQIFFPLGASTLKVDWLSSGNESSKVYGVKIDGTVDTANVGTTKDIWRVDGSQVHLITDASFYMDATKKGALDFSSDPVPAASMGETLYNVKCYFDGTKWKWYIVVSDGTGIVSDNTNAIDSSTSIFGAVAGGGADAGNKGSFKEIVYVESNFPYIPTTAKFRYDTTKKGALEFSSGAVPAPSSGETLYNPKFYFDGTIWKQYIVISDSGSPTVNVRVAWNFNFTEDLTEGEVVNYDPVTEKWTGSGTKVWIDWSLSKAVKFETGGDNTIFQADLVVTDKVRRNQTRDLYKLTLCTDDSGSAITHLYTKNTEINMLEGELLSSDLGELPWLGLESSKILTQIGGSFLINKMKCRVPKEWNTAEGNWQYVELTDFSRSLPYYFSPARPIMSDPMLKKYDSWYEGNNSLTIATYYRE